MGDLSDIVDWLNVQMNWQASEREATLRIPTDVQSSIRLVSIQKIVKKNLMKLVVGEVS